MAQYVYHPGTGTYLGLAEAVLVEVPDDLMETDQVEEYLAGDVPCVELSKVLATSTPQIVCHIKQANEESRWSYHDSDEDLRRELIEYHNEVHNAAYQTGILPDTVPLDEIIELIEEYENVSIDRNGPAAQVYIAFSAAEIDEEIERLATECMEHNEGFVQGWHSIAGTNHKIANGTVHDQGTRRIYGKYEAIALLEAVHLAHPGLSAAQKLQVAARIAERAET